MENDNIDNKKNELEDNISGNSNLEADSANGEPKSKGQVKWFNDAKGFGFIEHSDGSDVFVHFSVIGGDGFKTLKDGEEVVYEMKKGPKGFHAVKVNRVTTEEETSQEKQADSKETESEIDTTSEENKSSAA